MHFIDYSYFSIFFAFETNLSIPENEEYYLILT